LIANNNLLVKVYFLGEFSMVGLKRVLIISVISMIALAGCNKADKATTDAAPTAAVSSDTGAKGFPGLLSVVSNTQKAVEAGNFTQAKQEFAKFEDNWKVVEDGVKAKSPDGYKKIETNADTIDLELKGSTPNKDKALAALKLMSQYVNSVAK
jgi:hypothetical protein